MFKLFSVSLLLIAKSVLCIESLPQKIEKPSIIPGCQQYLISHPSLIEGGGIIISDSMNWVAIGVGTGSMLLPDGGKQSKGHAMIIADAKAMQELVSAIKGQNISNTEKKTSDSYNTKVNSYFRESFESTTRMETNGVISGSRIIGYWYLWDEKAIAVMRAIFSSGHPLTAVRSPFPVKSNDLTPEWKNEFLYRLDLKEGGVLPAIINNDMLLLVAAGAKISNPRQNSIRIATVKAQTEVLKFINGAKVNGFQELQTKSNQNSLDGKILSDVLTETFQTLTEIHIQGAVHGMLNVGGWVSEDGSKIFQAFILPLSTLSASH